MDIIKQVQEELEAKDNEIAELKNQLEVRDRGMNGSKELYKMTKRFEEMGETIGRIELNTFISSKVTANGARQIVAYVNRRTTFLYHNYFEGGNKPKQIIRGRIQGELFSLYGVNRYEDFLQTNYAEILTRISEWNPDANELSTAELDAYRNNYLDYKVMEPTDSVIEEADYITDDARLKVDTGDYLIEDVNYE